MQSHRARGLPGQLTSVGPYAQHAVTISLSTHPSGAPVGWNKGHESTRVTAKHCSQESLLSPCIPVSLSPSPTTLGARGSQRPNESQPLDLCWGPLSTLLRKRLGSPARTPERKAKMED